MFEILKPDKKTVGQRLRQVKDELNLSFTEFGNRLGLKKSTINAYVRGDNLAPLEVLEKVSKIYGKPVGWFYYGELEEYIELYLRKLGYGTFLDEYPDTPLKIKEELFRIKTNPIQSVTRSEGVTIGTFENPDWENEFGYPNEGYLDDIFFESLYDTLRGTIRKEAKTYLSQQDGLDATKINELSDYFANQIYTSYDFVGNLEILSKDKIKKEIKKGYERLIKDSPSAGVEVSYDSNYLLGFLINTLADSQSTRQLLSDMSQATVGMPFSQFHEGHELVEIIQSVRPRLIELYNNTTLDDWTDWVEK
ncbi:TPA: helix-turn-helix transcriptional regulator [Streptococcus agalactiae]|nr:helix-turn-helix transcriptional regulator [Streptococcus agalactiae]